MLLGWFELGEMIVYNASRIVASGRKTARRRLSKVTKKPNNLFFFFKWTMYLKEQVSRNII